MKGVTAKCSSGAAHAAAQHGVAVFLFDVCKRIVTNFCMLCSGDCTIAFAAASVPHLSAHIECLLDDGASHGFCFVGKSQRCHTWSCSGPRSSSAYRGALGGSSRGGQPSSVFTETCPAFPVCRNAAAGVVMALCDTTRLISLALRALVSLWLPAPESHHQQN